jgi:hypothetical protein
MKIKILTFPVTGELERDLLRVSKQMSLSRADVIRQSIRLGLPRFVAGFPKPAKPATAPKSTLLPQP